MNRYTIALISLPLAVVLLLINTRQSSSQGGPATPDISLKVAEWSSISRTSEPVTTGIPIPADATGYAWALFDGATEVPLQTTVLPGLKTPWLLLDFQSTNAANQNKQYTLKQQIPTASPSQPLAVTEDANQITVSTGPIQTQISKSDFNLLDTVWLDSNSNQSFENGEKVVNPSAGNLTISDVSVPNGGTGLLYSAVVSPTTGFTWEYQGVLRRTLRVDGSYQNPASTLPNHTLLNFTTRFTWYAGQTYVKVEHLIKNSYAPKERWVKLTSAKLNIGTATTTDQIAKSGDTIWANRSAGASVELIPLTLEISDLYDPNAGVGRLQQTLDVVANGGMIIGDLSYHGATVQLDFAAGLSAGEKTRRTTATKDPMIALAPENQYADLSAFGTEHFGTYQDEKDTYTKWGWTWPTPGDQWSEEHNRPRLPNFYPTWSTTEANDFEADELWQNIVMMSRVRIPYYLDRLRTYARFWKWEWTMRSDGYEFNGSWPFNPSDPWPSYWYYGNEISRAPAIKPSLTAADTDFINHNVKFAKADTTHMWNGGSLDYYYLTGDKDSLQAAIDLAEQCTLLFYGSTYNHTPANTSVSGTGSRTTTRCLQIFTRTWEATNDSQWKTAADGMLPFFLQSIVYDQRGFFYSDVAGICSSNPPAWCAQHPSGKFFSGFHTAVAVDALYQYYLLTDHQGAKNQLLQIAQFIRDNALDPVTGFGGNDYIIDSPNPGDVYRTADIYGRDSKTFVNTMVIGYRLTGDVSYLNQAKLAWGRGTKGVQGGEYATDTQVGRWENSLQAWQADSTLFPEGGDLHYANFLFYDVAREDILPPTGVGNASPGNNSIGVSTTPTLTAATAVDPSTPISYSFELYQGSSCSGATAQTRAYTTSRAWTPTALQSNTAYAWRNKARDAATTPNASTFGSCSVFVTVCLEDWSCSGWSVCSGGQQTRTCTELNNCGTAVNEPPLFASCTDPDTTPPASVSDLRVP